MPRSRSARSRLVEQKHANVWAYQIAQVYAWRGENGQGL